MKVEELFDRCLELAQVDEPTGATNRLMHETLVLCCAEGLKDSGQAYGNLFAQVDYLCKRHRVGMADRVAIQTMRRHSNSGEPLSREELMYDVRALCRLTSAVFSRDVPAPLVQLIPAEGRAYEGRQEARPYIRCIVSRWDDRYIYAMTDEGEITVDYTTQEKGIDHTYLKALLREGMQLNLLDSDASVPLMPRIIVVEPDFLMDISQIAACFTDYGHHPLLYTVNRLKPRANTQPILLGNFADTALDDIINGRSSESRRACSDGRVATDEGEANGQGDLAESMGKSFREQALQFCTCEDFNSADFVRDARLRMQNLREAAGVLFGEFSREKAVLEPSFVCERLGLQGRVDLMTTDMRLLVEHKSGKNRHIELQMNTGGDDSQRKSTHGLQLESHYVQLLLYYGILRYNFGVSDAKADIRLLYSKYPARQGLIVVNYYRQLFREAIRLRNKLVATEYYIAQKGFGRILPHLTPKVIYAGQPHDAFFTRYIEPQLSTVNRQLSTVTPLERAYYERMMTFVYREQLYAKVGSQEGRSTAIADLWNMPLSEKQETGSIYTGLTLTAFEDAERVTLAVPPCEAPNFRRGDVVCLYAYKDEPDICRSIIYKGTIADISSQQLVIRLSNRQQNRALFTQGQLYAVEHGSTEMTTGSNISSLQTFITAPPSRRALILGQRAPEADTRRQLSHSRHPDYDDVVLRALQARDYFLLVGPPGTGKTSMALRFLVEEHLSVGNCQLSIILTAYTNRAVDEISGMLSANGLDYIRIGNENSCDPRFADHLLDHLLGQKPKLDAIRQQLLAARIIVGTTSMLLSRPYIFQLKQFDVAIVDEASQILEPGLVGLLSRVPKFILIGDHKQLPAIVQQPEKESAVGEACLREIGLTDCRHSLFERLLRWEKHSGRSQFTGILRRQGRMHPDIAAFPNRMFYCNEHLEPVPCPHQLDTTLHYDLPSEDALDDLLKSRRMLFIDSSRNSQFSARALLAIPAVAPTRSLCYQRDARILNFQVSDKSNPTEARLVADLLRRIHRFYGQRFDADKTVGVIVPYRNQIAMIRSEIEQLGIDALRHISIDTVERYQGSQRDVIVYSFTVTRGYQMDFLTSNCFEEDGRTIDRKLNVAITRARLQMLMTGHAPLLRQNALFAALIDSYSVELSQ